MSQWQANVSSGIPFSHKHHLSWISVPQNDKKPLLSPCYWQFIFCLGKQNIQFYFGFKLNRSNICTWKVTNEMLAQHDWHLIQTEGPWTFVCFIVIKPCLALPQWWELTVDCTTKGILEQTSATRRESIHKVCPVTEACQSNNNSKPFKTVNSVKFS